MEGIIIKALSDIYIVRCNNTNILCKAKGVFRKNKILPLVGDRVIIDSDKKIITEILNRKNSLIRPAIANVDAAIIVMSVVKPDFSSLLVDKLINVIEFNNIKPIICLTKIDLISNMHEINKYVEYYKKIGYEVVFNTEIDKIKELLKNKITVITGQSGVGKSTLLNKLDSNLSLKTNEISIALGRGKHTTRHVELIDFMDGFVADTPGFSSLELDLTENEIRDAFTEFGFNCKYNTCNHTHGNGCDVIKRVKEGKILESRYNNYIKLIEEDKHVSKW